MKSLMEEASSIIKAVEKAWEKAGHPKEFTIKVFEEPIKNFIGMTTRSAKVGIFFSDGPLKSHDLSVSKPKPAPRQQFEQRPLPQEKREHQPRAQHQERQQRQPQPKRTAPETHQEQQTETRAPQNQPVWSPTMIEDARTWLVALLQEARITTPFDITAQHFHLKIIFKEPVFDDANRQKQLFASLATVILQMMKHRYKRPLKGYKVILTTGTHHAQPS